MNAQQLLDHVGEILGFRVSERENDAVLVREPDFNGRSSVRPATREEVIMYLRILGMATLVGDLSAEGNSLRERNNILQSGMAISGAENAKLTEALRAEYDRFQAQKSQAEVCHENCDRLLEENERLKATVQKMGVALQSADARIKEIMAANHGLGLENERLKAANAELDGRLEDKESELRDVLGRNEDIEEKLKELGVEV